MRWWIKAWEEDFPYSPEEIVRVPQCLQIYQPKKGVKAEAKKGESRWEAPEKGYLKWNVDASIQGEEGRGGIGGVPRDWEGNFRCLFSMPIGRNDINTAEVLAIQKAIEVSKMKEWVNHLNMIIESDSQNAVTWCNTDEGRPWNVSFALNQIRSWRRGTMGVEIRHQGRETNGVADTMAKQGVNWHGYSTG